MEIELQELIGTCHPTEHSVHMGWGGVEGKRENLSRK